MWSSEEEDSGGSSDGEGEEVLPVNTIDNGSSDDEVVESEEDYGVKSAQSRFVIQASERNVPINLVLRLR